MFLFSIMTFTGLFHIIYGDLESPLKYTVTNQETHGQNEECCPIYRNIPEEGKPVVKINLQKKLPKGEQEMSQEELQRLHEVIQEAYGVPKEAVCMAVTYSKKYAVSVGFENEDGKYTDRQIMNAGLKATIDTIEGDVKKIDVVYNPETKDLQYVVTFKTNTCSEDAEEFPFHDEDRRRTMEDNAGTMEDDAGQEPTVIHEEKLNENERAFMKKRRRARRLNSFQERRKNKLKSRKNSKLKKQNADMKDETEEKIVKGGRIKEILKNKNKNNEKQLKIDEKRRFTSVLQRKKDNQARFLRDRGLISLLK